jgi:hypothetical protein
MKHTSHQSDSAALVGDETLLEIIFPNDADRPGVRWLAAMRRKRLIPFRKIGGRIVRYDVAEVRAALDRNFTVKSI